MSSMINVPASLIADSMGLLLLICVVTGNLFVFRKEAKRNSCLVILIIVTACSCILDGISAVADGQNRIAVIVSNTLLYICGPIEAVLWIVLVAKYIKVRLSLLHKIIIGVFFSVSLVLIITNLFAPVLFTVNEYGLYKREDGLYLIYATSYFGLLLDSVAMYLMKKHDSGGLKLFPMWAFVIPVAIGIIIQNMFFGVSTIPPFIALSLTNITMTFQNNILFRDQLTDLYNRYYLSVLEKRFSKKSGREYSVIMLDINGFKRINDIHGHDAGDEALVEVSKILISIVDKSGEIIRYAGDEFVIILNSHDDEVTEALISRIHQSLADFNSKAAVPYKLSVAVGWCRFAFGEKTLNDFLTEADKRMYINKQEYYRTHQEQDRRKR